MKRREFIAGLGSAAAWPLMAWAQQGDRVRRIGMLWPTDENDPLMKASGGTVATQTQQWGVMYVVGRGSPAWVLLQAQLLELQKRRRKLLWEIALGACPRPAYHDKQGARLVQNAFDKLDAFARRRGESRSKIIGAARSMIGEGSRGGHPECPPSSGPMPSALVHSSRSAYWRLSQ